MTLSPEDRVRVSKMAAILRVADALDRAHQGKIRDIRALIEDERVIINALGPQDLTLERWGLNRKADMFQQVFGRKIVLERRS
jgi:exopolyphosphatase/guanosine-5'-triphosphate,3'-diphosphate pyrophosphatase